VTDHTNPFHVALNELLAASYHAKPEELTPIFNAISALAEKYKEPIAQARREAQDAFVASQMAGRGRKR
jgi:hypothetical protein